MLLNNRIRPYRLLEASASMQQADNLLVCCHLGLSLGTMIVKQTISTVQQRSTRSTTLQHVFRVDAAPPPDDHLPELEIELPHTLRSALDREVAAAGIDWAHLLRGQPASTRLRLSTAELFELCEVLAPGDWTMDPVGLRRVEIHSTGVSVAPYDEVRRELGPATFLKRVKTAKGDRWG
jgi:hypothetical protein